MKTITAFLLAAGASLVHAQDDTSAATKYGWGTPVQEDDFNGSTLSSDWGVYDGPGQDGNGIRSPSAFSLSDSILTVTGTPNGTTGGMAWSGGQMYGRWETRAKYTAGTSAYHCVLLLWPDAENWPEGGEIDYSEVGDGTRQTLDFFLHYGSDNSQLNGETTIDMTQWRNYAIEWTSDHIIGYVDAVPFFQTTQQSALPPASMHATIQLDWFPEDGEEGPGEMQVDWIRQYTV